MPLSRWSHSAHYIYECDDDEIQVSMFGHYRSREILNFYDKIELKAKEEGYSFLERLELRAYLKSWAKFVNNKMDYKSYSRILHLLRTLGWIKSYVRVPYRCDFSMELYYYLSFFYWGLRKSKAERRAEFKKRIEEKHGSQA